MIFTCPASTFRDAFTFIHHCIGGRKEMEYNLVGFEYLVEDDKLTLVGLSPEVHLHRTIDVQSMNKASGTGGGVTQVVYGAVLADRVAKFIRAAYAPGDIVVEFEADTIEFNLGGETIHLEQYDARKIEAARSMRALKPTHTFEDVPIKPLIDAFHSLMECSADKGIRASMRHFELRDGVFLGSDGSRVRVIEDPEFPAFAPLKITPAVTKLVHGALKSLKPDTMSLNFTTGRAAFVDKETFILLRLGDWKFPKVEENIRQHGEPDWTYTGDTAELRKSLTVVSLGLGAGKTAIWLDPSGNKLMAAGNNSKGRQTSSHPKGEVIWGSMYDHPAVADPESPEVSVEHLLSTIGKTGQVSFGAHIQQKALIFKEQAGDRVVYTAIPFKAKGRTIADAKIERMSKG